VGFKTTIYEKKAGKWTKNFNAQPVQLNEKPIKKKSKNRILNDFEDELQCAKDEEGCWLVCLFGSFFTLRGFPFRLVGAISVGQCADGGVRRAATPRDLFRRVVSAKHGKSQKAKRNQEERRVVNGD